VSFNTVHLTIIEPRNKRVTQNLNAHHVCSEGMRKKTVAAENGVSDARGRGRE